MLIGFSVLGEDEETDEITVSKGLCGVTIPRPIVSSGRDVAIKFKSRYMSIGTGFQAVVTPMQGLSITGSVAIHRGCPL